MSRNGGRGVQRRLESVAVAIPPAIGVEQPGWGPFNGGGGYVMRKPLVVFHRRGFGIGAAAVCRPGGGAAQGDADTLNGGGL